MCFIAIEEVPKGFQYSKISRIPTTFMWLSLPPTFCTEILSNVEGDDHYKVINRAWVFAIIMETKRRGLLRAGSHGTQGRSYVREEPVKVADEPVKFEN